LIGFLFIIRAGFEVIMGRLGLLVVMFLLFCLVVVGYSFLIFIGDLFFNVRMVFGQLLAIVMEILLFKGAMLDFDYFPVIFVLLTSYWRYIYSTPAWVLVSFNFWVFDYYYFNVLSF
jgi:hypothetical protein